MNRVCNNPKIFFFIMAILILCGFFFMPKQKEELMVVAYDQPVAYEIADYSQMVAALAEIDPTSNVVLTIVEDITIDDNVVLRGKVEIKATEKKTLNLNDCYIDIKNGTEAIFRNLDIVQSENSSVAQTVLFRDNLKQGSAYFFDCHITTGSANVLKSTSVNGRFFLTDTVLQGGECSLHKGAMFLAGISSFAAPIEATTYVYDFRNAQVIATPSTDDFTTNMRAELYVDQKPFYYRGSADETEKMDMKVCYTLDGSDPLFSATRREYTTPISLIVDREIRACMVFTTNEMIYSGAEFVFRYDVNPDKTPGTTESVDEIAEYTLRCGSEAADLELPEAVKITVDDGRELYALVEWNFNDFDSSVAGSFTLTGDLILPYFISNPQNIKAVVTVNIYYNDIEDFVFDQYETMQEGKNTAYTGFTVGAFAARGGNEVDYEYTFVDDASGRDNNKFILSGNELVIKKSLNAGTYLIHLKVASGGKTADLSFSLMVAEKARVVEVIANPYADIDWDTINFVKTATHNHTFYSSGSFEKSEHNDNASDTVDERVARYVEMGYGAVIITEHDYVALEEVGGVYENPDVLKLYGNELSKNYHMLYYGLSPYYDMKGAGVNNSNGIDGNFDNIAAQGDGIGYFAHPNRSTTDKDYWLNLFNKHDIVYGMEVFNAGQAANNYSEDLWDYILTNTMPERPIYGTASDDAHSNGAAGTGWQIMLLADDDMNSEGLLDALKYGNTFMATICVDPETDDNKSWDAVTGPLPAISKIEVDEETGTITVNAANYHTIEWISAGGKVVGTGAVLDLNANYGIEKYVRCRIYGDEGMIHTQPFGVAYGDEYYEGIPEESEEPDDEEPITNPGEDEEPIEEPKKKGCKSVVSSLNIVLIVILLVLLVFMRFKKKKQKNT